MNLSDSNLADFDFRRFAHHWQIRPDTTFLNFGSFGPTPIPVLEERIRWIRELESQPMDLLIRQLEGLLEGVCASLGSFFGGDPANFVLVSNATVAMNIVAENFMLGEGDEVLLNDHEYGAVIRIWGQKCKEAGARTVIARLPEPLTDADSLVEALFSRVTPRTKLIVVSHVTSATATIFPVHQICRRARQLGIPVCVDGPHALAMTPLNIDQLDCDYYCASCHKWLCGPIGTGFLWVKSKHKQGLKPAILSWGRSLTGREPSWKDEFHWSGTFDPTACLALPTAIQFLRETIGVEQFRRQSHALARYARQRLCAVTGSEALVPDSIDWYGPMVTIPLPQVPCAAGRPGTTHPLQKWLWDKHRIEIPVMEWHDRVHLRVSCHMPTQPEQIDKLADAVLEWLTQQRRAGLPV